jgi:hypothetical protein
MAIMAAVTHATTNMEIPEITLIILRDFFEKRYLLDMKRGTFTDVKKRIKHEI